MRIIWGRLLEMQIPGPRIWGEGSFTRTRTGRGLALRIFNQLGLFIRRRCGEDGE